MFIVSHQIRADDGSQYLLPPPKKTRQLEADTLSLRRPFGRQVCGRKACFPPVSTLVPPVRIELIHHALALPFKRRSLLSRPVGPAVALHSQSMFTYRSVVPDLFDVDRDLDTNEMADLGQAIK